MSSDHPLLQEIQKGESQTLEFKEQLPKGQQVAKTLIAFANTSGGKLVVGVSDDRQLVGIQDDIFELQDKITSMIYELCAPQLAAQIYIENIDGGNYKEECVHSLSDREIPGACRNPEQDCHRGDPGAGKDDLS